ncbi:uncharacterized protein C2orf81 homolog [Centroberyx gerrardi]
MSRSAAKSRADKGGRRPSAQAITPQAITPRPQDLDVEEIIPGRLTQAQWMDMLREEDAEETVGEIMEELLSQVMEGCFKAYIQRQLVPFSTSWAKDCLVQVLEWQFLHRDEGEGPEEASRTEDSEPLPATADSWAQGCVPVINTTPPPHPTPQQGAADGQVAGRMEPRANQQCHVMAQTSSSTKQSEKDRSPSEPEDYRSHRHKDYRRIPRLDHSCLPRHGVSPQYEILDTNHTKPHPKRPSRLSIPERRLDKQQTEWTGSSLKPLTSCVDQPAKLQGRNGADVWLSLRKKSTPTGHKREGIIPFSGSLRLDTMDLVQGVSLVDPQVVQLNPLKLNRPAQSTKLRPMRSGPAVPLFSVEQLTAGPPPQVTPLEL